MGAVRKTESNITSDYLSDVIYTHVSDRLQSNRPSEQSEDAFCEAEPILAKQVLHTCYAGMAQR